MSNGSTEAELRKRLERQPFLVINCETVTATLESEAGMHRAIASPVHFVMDARTAFNEVKKLVADRDTFSLTDVAKAAGVEYFAAHAWLRRGIIGASIRSPDGAGRGRGPIFSFADVFAAGIIGTLRRRGIGHAVTSCVTPLLSGEVKQTASKSSASKRS